MTLRLVADSDPADVLNVHESMIAEFHEMRKTWRRELGDEHVLGLNRIIEEANYDGRVDAWGETIVVDMTRPPRREDLAREIRDEQHERRCAEGDEIIGRRLMGLVGSEANRFLRRCADERARSRERRQSADDRSDSYWLARRAIIIATCDQDSPLETLAGLSCAMWLGTSRGTWGLDLPIRGSRVRLKLVGEAEGGPLCAPASLQLQATGVSIRADILLKTKDRAVFVECDGRQHNEPRAAHNDRKERRKRWLRLGIHTENFDGIDLHNDPWIVARYAAEYAGDTCAIEPKQWTFSGGPPVTSVW